MDSAFTLVSKKEIEDGFNKTVCDIETNLDFAKKLKLFPEAVVDFCRCSCSRQIAKIPIIRGLIKIHKPQLSVRLLVANTRWITSPLAVWLAATLQPIVDTFATVASSSKDITDRLETIHLDEADRIHSFDVEQLYPSIDQQRAIGTLHDCLVRHFSQNPVPQWGALVELIVAVVTIIFGAQFAVFHLDGQQVFYRQSEAISTGLACGSQLANCFLEALDRSYGQSFGPQTKLYQRYIDDILVITATHLADIVELLNNFDVRIQVTHEASQDGIRTSFLDLDICRSGNKYEYETFRKPMCTYDYLPFNSCHSRRAMIGIFKGELIRLLRTNCHECNFDRHADFTQGKLLERGYDRTALRKIRSELTWACRSKLIEKRPICASSSQRVLPFKIRYSDAVHEIGPGQLLTSLSDSLPPSFKAAHRVLLCHVSNKNMFRLRY